MPEPLQFDLVSPERLLVSETVEQVVVPGSEGYFTVLRDHAPFMTTLKPGVVEVHDGSGGVVRIVVLGGFADVTPAGLTILAEEAFPAEEVTADLIADRVRRAERAVAAAGENHERRAAAEKRVSDLRLLAGERGAAGAK